MASIKSILLGVILTLSLTGWADALYWFVASQKDDNSHWYATSIKDDGAPIQYDTVRVKANGNYLNLVDDEGKEIKDIINSVDAEYASIPGNASYVDGVAAKKDSWAFVIELFNAGSLSPIAESEELTYDNLFGMNHIATDSSSRVEDWAPIFTATIPEPTSGLLMLFGAAMLALKRRRA